jgi:Domain of unknown function (DUF4293)
MIQRQQTLWLLLATIAAVLSFMFPFLVGKEIRNGVEVDKILKADSDFILVILTSASLVLSGVTIFLYKDRPLQIKLCVLGILLAVAIIALYILQMDKVMKPTLALFSVLPFLMLIGYYMAFRNIRKDEKLVKSLDKLR